MKEEPINSAVFEDASPESIEMRPVLTELMLQLTNKGYNFKFAEMPAYQTVQVQNAAYRGRLVLAVATAMHRCRQRDELITRYQLGKLLSALLRGTLGLGEDDYLRLFKLYGLDFSVPDPSLNLWPFSLSLTLSQIERLAKKQGQLSQPLLNFLTLLHRSDGGRGDIAKINLKVQTLLNQANPDALPVVRFDGGDAFGRSLNAFIANLLPPDQLSRPWVQLLGLLATATGGRPTAKLAKELAAATAAVGPDAVREQGRAWLELLAYLPLADFRTARPASQWAGDSYLLEINQSAAKGLLWVLAPLADAPLLQQLADLAGRCLRKQPGAGPLAISLGNVALLILSQKGLSGVAHLASLRPRVAQENTKALIAGYLVKASQALGMSADEIEDLSVPDYGLRDGQASFGFGEYEARLALVGSKAELRWTKAGKTLKSAPTALKARHAAELRGLKLAQGQAQHTYTTQRDRLDRSFLTGRRIPWGQFAKNYLVHGLLGPLVRGLVWRIQRPDNSSQDALWLDGAWCDAHGQPLPLAPTDADTVQLWHPVLSATAEVLAWRALLEQRRLRQPLKQAFREVYLLTPPEETTRTYSNRMAAHLLRQHQFSALARGRGWQYRLMGAYDKGYESDSATLELPAHGLQAQFWVSEVNADGAYNPTGIWNYVSTDQLRFTRAGVAVPLPEIPALAFSEVMRDVDLFVGVASVGNDPAWRDNGGLPAYRNYWESYSFGELGEVAKNRKMALERLVPRLKIGKVSAIKDRFLVVCGKVRTYKIHLGSGNILMEPNDQYLCIVPDRTAKTVGSPDVFLPFEGDAVLSIILSKALLLMDDDKITDETILRQIR